jgi:ketosteroid isomerase-like protein
MTTIFASLLLAATIDPNSAAVFQAEVALNNAVAAHDVKAIASMITDDYTLGFSNGKLYSHDTFLKVVADPSLVVTENRARDEAVRFYGSDVAVVTGILETKGTYQGQAVSYTERFTDTWYREGGTWKQAAGQAAKTSD